MKISTIAPENCKKSVFKNFTEKKLFYLIREFVYFIQGCGKLRTFLNICYLNVICRRYFQINLVEKGIFKSIFVYLENRRTEELYKEGVLEKFAKFVGKDLSIPAFLLDKVAE